MEWTGYPPVTAVRIRTISLVAEVEWFILVKTRADQHAALEGSIFGPRSPEPFQ
jgi:hypothetical protein